ncbi:MAG TPA: copper resistance protein CopC [bacterium]
MVISAWALLAFLLGGASAISAHGILERSSPKANAVLPGMPREIVLEFSEGADPRFSQVQVVGPQGRTIAQGGVVSGDGRLLRLAVGGGEAGVYTVRWRVLSAVDGHTASGSFIFAVGAETALPAARPSVSAFPPTVLIFARWLSYLASFLLAGTVLFDAFIVRRTLLGGETPLHTGGFAQNAEHLRRLRVISGIVVLATLAFEFMAQGGEVIGAGVGAVLRRDVISSLLLQTKLGWSAMLRAYAAVLLLLPDGSSGRILRAAGLIWLVVFTGVVILLGGPSALGSSHVALIVLVGSVYGLASILAARIIPAVLDIHVPAWWGAQVVAVAALLAGFTLTSHAGGSGVILAVSDWLHLLAAAAWVGGLPALILSLRLAPAEDRPAVGRLLVPRFSGLAGMSLLVLVVTGTAAAWKFVASLQGLVGSLYGRSLLVKLSLVSLMAVLGAVNRFVLRPRIVARDPESLARFHTTAGVEIGAGVIVLLVVGALGIMPPTAATPPRPDAKGPAYAADLNGRPLVVRVTPAASGLNEVTVSGIRASVRFRRLDTLDEVAVGPDGTVELVDGWWEIAVSAEGAQAIFPLIVGTPRVVADPLALRYLNQAESGMKRVRTWREVEQITDGNGHVVVTQFEAAQPNRLRYSTTSGSEAVIIGAIRTSRERGGAWTRDRLPQPITLEGLYVPFLAGATAARFGAMDRCGAEICRIVLWVLPSGQAHFAARIGRSGRIYQLEMVAPAHYMTSRADRLNAPLTITLP